MRDIEILHDEVCKRLDRIVKILSAQSEVTKLKAKNKGMKKDVELPEDSVRTKLAALTALIKSDETAERIVNPDKFGCNLRREAIDDYRKMLREELK